jgi:hypothetical protein
VFDLIGFLLDSSPMMEADVMEEVLAVLTRITTVSEMTVAFSDEDEMSATARGAGLAAGPDLPGLRLQAFDPDSGT